MRIRTIKPEFWRSTDVSALRRDDRLLFIALWSYVDDDGVGRDELPAIIGDLFAADMVANPPETVAMVSGGLSRLESAGLIERYEVEGDRYLHVVTWADHQKVDKPRASRYPGPDMATDQGFSNSSRIGRETVAPGTEEQGNRGTEEQGEKNMSRTAPRLATPLHPNPPESVLVAVEADDPPPKPGGRNRRKGYTADFEEFWAAYPRHDDGKFEASQAWSKALQAAGSVAVIVAGAARYAADPNRDPAFTKLGATWLNRHCWEDGPLPPRSGPGGRSATPGADALRHGAAVLAQIDAEQAPAPAPREAIGWR